MGLMIETDKTLCELIQDYISLNTGSQEILFVNFIDKYIADILPFISIKTNKIKLDSLFYDGNKVYLKESIPFVKCFTPISESLEQSSNISSLLDEIWIYMEHVKRQ